MNRRRFLQAAAAASFGTTALAKLDDDEMRALREVKITRITGFTHVCPRPKLIGKNSRRDVHGRFARDSVLRIATNQGIEGVGVGRATKQTATKLIGHTLDEFWKPGRGVDSPFGRADHSLYDLVGKALKKPTWKLFGGKGPEWMPVYDGSIYFADLLPDNAGKGVAPLLKEVEAGLKKGHRAFKIKIGRGAKWMEKKAGFQRDVDVVQAIRKLAGKDVKLMVDANNGYNLDTAKRFLDTAGDDFHFVEEMFPEKVEDDLDLKAFLGKKGWKTLVADGESAREVKHFDAYVEKGALDVLQPDIRAFGLTLQWELSRKIATTPKIKLAPHNWGSFLGLYAQLILGRGIPNFLMAEQDPGESDLFDTSAFTFKDGKMRVPGEPGAGLVIRENVFKKKYEKDAWVVGKN